MEAKEDMSVVSDNDDIDEDISRLQIILQDGEADDGGSDVELMVWNSDQNQLQRGYRGSYDDDFQSQPSRLSTSSDVTASSLPTTSMCTDVDHDIGLRFDPNAVNADSCLAINRAYQEVLLDQLRQIEVALVENRAQQKSVQEDIDNDCKHSTQGAPKHKQLLLFTTPFFKDDKGATPPFNEDVKVKESMQETKQLIKPKLGWTKNDRKVLANAVGKDALEQLSRPILSKLEVETDKIQKCKTVEEIDAGKSRIQSLKQQLSDKQKIPLDKLLKYVNASKVDFLKISVVTFKGKYEGQECESMWRNVLRPGINRGKWTEEEDEKLEKLVIEHHQRNWQRTAVQLGTNRTPFQCLQHYQQMAKRFNTGEWTTEEDQTLVEAVEMCRYGTCNIQWYQVAYYLENRSAAMCQNRFKKINPDMKRGKWTAQEDCALISAVNTLGKDWIRIADLVSHRQPHQCRERWINVLYPMLGSKGTYDEDKQLLKLHAQYGDNWQEITKEMPGLSEKMVQNRYKKLLSWKTKMVEFYNTWKLSSSSDAPEGYRQLEDGNLLPLTAYFQQDKATELDRLIMEKHKESLSTSDDGSNTDTTDFQRQLLDWANNDIVVPRPLPGEYQNSMSLRSLHKNHMDIITLIKVESQDMADSQTTVDGLVTELSHRGQEDEELRYLTELLQKKTPLTVMELFKIKKFMAKMETTETKGEYVKEQLFREFETKFNNSVGKKKKRKKVVKMETWSSDENEHFAGVSDGHEEESEKEEQEEEEDGVVQDSADKIKMASYEEKNENRIIGIRENMEAYNELKRIIETKMDPAGVPYEPSSKRKRYTMYPDSVLWKHRYKDAAEETRMGKKSLMLLMKTLDVDARAACRKARSAKRKSSAAALLKLTEKRVRTRRSVAKDTNASNESNEAVDALLDLREELNIDDEEEEGSETVNTGNQVKVTVNTGNQVKETVNTGNQVKKTVNTGNQDHAGYSGHVAGSSVYRNDEPEKQLPYLPPNVTSLQGLRYLLQDHRSMFDTAASHVLDMRAVERVKVLRKMIHKPQCFSLVRVKNPSKSVVKKERDEDGFTSAILKARCTKEYKQLKARFVSLFGWPGLLSSVETEEMIDVPEDTVEDDVAQDEREEDVALAAETDEVLGADITNENMTDETLGPEITDHDMTDEALGLNITDHNMTDEEAINKLVDKIMDRYKARRGQAKKKMKKMSQRMMKATHDRERRKILKKLGVLEKMEAYKRQRNEQAATSTTSSQEAGCQSPVLAEQISYDGDRITVKIEDQDAQNNVEEHEGVPHEKTVTGERTGQDGGNSSEHIEQTSTTGEFTSMEVGESGVVAGASQTSAVPEAANVIEISSQGDKPTTGTKIVKRKTGRPLGTKNRIAPPDGTTLRKSSRPSKQSWKEALMDKPKSPKKKKQQQKPSHLQEILPEVEDIISHISEPVRENIIHSVGTPEYKTKGKQCGRPSKSREKQGHTKAKLSRHEGQSKTKLGRGRVKTTANLGKGQIERSEKLGKGQSAATAKLSKGACLNTPNSNKNQRLPDMSNDVEDADGCEKQFIATRVYPRSGNSQPAASSPAANSHKVGSEHRQVRVHSYPKSPAQRTSADLSPLNVIKSPKIIFVKPSDIAGPKGISLLNLSNVKVFSGSPTSGLKQLVLKRMNNSKTKEVHENKVGDPKPKKLKTNKSTTETVSSVNGAIDIDKSSNISLTAVCSTEGAASRNIIPGTIEGDHVSTHPKDIVCTQTVTAPKNVACEPAAETNKEESYEPRLGLFRAPRDDSERRRSRNILSPIIRQKIKDKLKSSSPEKLDKKNSSCVVSSASSKTVSDNSKKIKVKHSPRSVQKSPNTAASLNYSSVSKQNDRILEQRDKYTIPENQKVQEVRESKVGEGFKKLRAVLTSPDMDLIPRSVHGVKSVDQSGQACVHEDGQLVDQSGQAYVHEDSQLVDQSGPARVHEDGQLVDQPGQARVHEDSQLVDQPGQAHVHEDSQLVDQSGQARVHEDSQLVDQSGQARVHEDSQLVDQPGQARVHEDSQLVDQSGPARVHEDGQLVDQPGQARVHEDSQLVDQPGQARVLEDSQLVDQPGQACVHEDSQLVDQPGQARVHEDSQLVDQSGPARVHEDSQLVDQSGPARVHEDSQLVDQSGQARVHEDSQLVDQSGQARVHEDSQLVDQPGQARVHEDSQLVDQPGQARIHEDSQLE